MVTMLLLYGTGFPSHGQVDDVSRIGVVLRVCRERGERGKRPLRRRRGDRPAWALEGRRQSRDIEFVASAGRRRV